MTARIVHAFLAFADKDTRFESTARFGSTASHERAKQLDATDTATPTQNTPKILSNKKKETGLHAGVAKKRVLRRRRRAPGIPASTFMEVNRKAQKVRDMLASKKSILRAADRVLEAMEEGNNEARPSAVDARGRKPAKGTGSSKTSVDNFMTSWKQLWKDPIGYLKGEDVYEAFSKLQIPTKMPKPDPIGVNELDHLGLKDASADASPLPTHWPCVKAASLWHYIASFKNQKDGNSTRDALGTQLYNVYSTMRAADPRPVYLGLMSHENETTLMFSHGDANLQ